MSRPYVPRLLRRQVEADAQGRCGYCRSPSSLTGAELDVEHIIPVSSGGQTVRENLWLACSGCNGHKGSRVGHADPATGETVRLYDPRRQRWREHFAWSADASRIVGLTPTGRATVDALQLNRPRLVEARRLWRLVGWQPSEE